MSGLIIGVGNRYRGDDGAGCIVAEKLRGLVPSSVRIVEHDGEPLALLSLWDQMPWCIVVDAVKEDNSPHTTIGRVLLFDFTTTIVSGNFSSFSSHGYGVREAAAMGRTLGRIPAHLIVVGIIGGCFDPGAALSDVVKEAINNAVSVVLRVVAALEGQQQVTA